MDCLDIVYKIATVIIALANIVFAIIIFKRNKKRDLVKTLVLDYSIEHFYKYFEDLDNELSRLKTQCNDKTKKEIEQNILSLGVVFEQRFIDLFLHVNPKLHEEIKHRVDDMVGKLTTSMFDEGVNIYVKTQFNEKIANVVVVTKASIIKLLIEKSN